MKTRRKFQTLMMCFVLVICTVCFIIPSNALDSMSADQIMSGKDEHDLAKLGGNDPGYTDLGDITGEESFYAFGWYSTSVEEGIAEFGYRYGDAEFWGSSKFYFPDDSPLVSDNEGIAALSGGFGESVRFKIQIPVVKGENIEVVAMVRLGDDDVYDMWNIYYSSETGIDMPTEGNVTPKPTEEPTAVPEKTEEPPTAVPTAQPTAVPATATSAPVVTEAPKTNEKGPGNNLVWIPVICALALIAIVVILLIVKNKRKR